MDYSRVNKITCSLEGGYAYFRGVFAWMHKNNGPGWLKVMKNLL